MRYFSIRDACHEVLHRQLAETNELAISDGLVLVLVLIAPGADVGLQGGVQTSGEDDPAMALAACLGPGLVLLFELGQIARGAV